MYSVRLTRIPEEGTAREEGIRVGLEQLGLKAPFEEPGAQLSWELTRLAGKVFGRASASASARLTCSRCLGEFSLPLRADFQVLFEPAGDAGSAEADGEELVVAFRGEELPLGEELRQELELALPFTPLCRPACAGLCPTCGADLNQGACGCKPHSKD